MLPNIAPMIPPASEALRHKLRTVTQQQLTSTSADAAAVPSPCISVCRMDDARQYCVGCLRTLDELRAWGSADAATKRDIWQRIRTRCNSDHAPAPATTF